MTTPVYFDYFNLPETPTFILCNPNMEELYSLGGISERKYSPRFNSFSELSFRADKYVDDALMPYYDYLTYRRLVHVVSSEIESSGSPVGYFMITGVEENGDGVSKYKNIKCQSLEVELMTKKISLFEGTHKFYDYYESGGGEYMGWVSLTDTSLMATIMREYIPNWSLQIHDSEGILTSKYRTFDISDTTVYTFLTTDISEAFDCIFIFDNENRHIHAYTAGSTIIDEDSPTHPTDIFISHDNVIKNIKVEESTDNLCTALTVLGGGALEIRQANPLATNKIYAFDYFKTTDWMTQDLIDAINAWEQTIEDNQALQQTTIASMNTANGLIGETNVLLSEGEADKAALVIQRDAAIEEGNQSQVDALNAQIAIYDSWISASTVYKESQETIVTDCENTLSQIASDCSLTNENNFTSGQQLNLQPFIIETTYINENFVEQSSSSATQLESEELYNQGKEALRRIKEPRYRIEIDSVNIIMIKEFETFQKQIGLGKTVTLEIKDGVYITPIILGYDINFDDPTDFKILLGNRMHLDDDTFQYGEIMKEALSATSKTRLKSKNWDNWNSEHLEEVTAFIESPINATQNNIISSTSREVVMDSSGITAKNSSAPDEQLSLNSKIMVTGDSWTTASMVIGKILFSNMVSKIPQEADIIDGEASGVIANSLVGHIVAGEKLVIANSSGSFVVGADSISIVIRAANGHNVIYLNPTVGIKITKDGGNILSLDSNGNLIITHS